MTYFHQHTVGIVQDLWSLRNRLNACEKKVLRIVLIKRVNVSGAELRAQDSDGAQSSR